MDLWMPGNIQLQLFTDTTKQKKEPLFSDSFGLVAEEGLEPTTFGL